MADLNSTTNNGPANDEAPGSTGGNNRGQNEQNNKEVEKEIIAEKQIVTPPAKQGEDRVRELKPNDQVDKDNKLEINQLGATGLSGKQKPKAKKANQKRRTQGEEIELDLSDKLAIEGEGAPVELTQDTVENFEAGGSDQGATALTPEQRPTKTPGLKIPRPKKKPDKIFDKSKVKKRYGKDGAKEEKPKSEIKGPPIPQKGALKQAAEQKKEADQAATKDEGKKGAETEDKNKGETAATRKAPAEKPDQGIKPKPTTPDQSELETEKKPKPEEGAEQAKQPTTPKEEAPDQAKGTTEPAPRESTEPTSAPFPKDQQPKESGEQPSEMSEQPAAAGASTDQGPLSEQPTEQEQPAEETPEAGDEDEEEKKGDGGEEEGDEKKEEGEQGDDEKDKEEESEDKDKEDDAEEAGKEPPKTDNQTIAQNDIEKARQKKQERQMAGPEDLAKGPESSEQTPAQAASKRPPEEQRDLVPSQAGRPVEETGAKQSAKNQRSAAAEPPKATNQQDAGMALRAKQALLRKIKKTKEDILNYPQNKITGILNSWKAKLLKFFLPGLYFKIKSAVGNAQKAALDVAITTLKTALSALKIARGGAGIIDAARIWGEAFSGSNIVPILGPIFMILMFIPFVVVVGFFGGALVRAIDKFKKPLEDLIKALEKKRQNIANQQKALAKANQVENAVARQQNVQPPPQPANDNAAPQQPQAAQPIALSNPQAANDNRQRKAA